MKIRPIVLLTLLFTGCSYSNSTSDQASPPTSYLHTSPGGCTLLIVDRNLELRTPCELAYDVDLDDELLVRKNGYQSWRGTLADLPRTADRTYRLELEPLR